jgi:putative oxidoreductase
MIYHFAIGLIISLLASRIALNLPALNLLSNLYPGFPDGISGIALLVLRVGTGLLFILHGYPKITHLRQWSNALKMPISLCFLSALSMLLGGVCLIIGFLTPFASVAILVSMLFAMFLEISQGLPFVAHDPYQIPAGQYEGPQGKGEPPSWEKAFMYCLMLVAIAVIGPGAFSLDAIIFG